MQGQPFDWPRIDHSRIFSSAASAKTQATRLILTVTEIRTAGRILPNPSGSRRAADPKRFAGLAPIKRISRRSWAHRLTSRVLEPRRVIRVGLPEDVSSAPTSRTDEKKRSSGRAGSRYRSYPLGCPNVQFGALRAAASVRLSPPG